MAPLYSRQLVIWSIPTVAVLFSYFWYRRKRINRKSDPGDTIDRSITPSTPPTSPQHATSSTESTPNRCFSRSLSGVDSAPIDIIIPPKLKGVKSNPIVISDEDLDLEIEKIKSMRYGGSMDTRKVDDNSTTEAPQKPASPLPQILPEENTLNMETKQTEQPGLQNLERDSANHSPTDPMLGSPSLSSLSDNHSEGSNDSGKGGSEVVTPQPPSTSLPETSTSDILIYDFLIPSNLVGKLIGKNGSTVISLKEKTGVRIIVRKHPDDAKVKVVSVEGIETQIQSALKIIRNKFPLKHFSDLSLKPFEYVPPTQTVALEQPEQFYIKLIEGENNDTCLCIVVATDHLFVHKPMNDTFQDFNALTECINQAYSEASTPRLPNPIPENTICVAFFEDAWYRVMVLETDTRDDLCYVRFLDNGGSAWVSLDCLRQIRSEFMNVPFQAIECFLYNIKPPGGNENYSDEALKTVIEMTHKSLFYTHIHDFTEDGIPLVYIYIISGESTVIFLNKYLVRKGHAEWIDQSEVPTMEFNEKDTSAVMYSFDSLPSSLLGQD